MAEEQIDPRRTAFVELRRRCFMGGGPFMWAAAAPLELRDLLPLVAGSDGYSLLVVSEGIVLEAYGDVHHVGWSQLTPGSLLELHSQMMAGQALVLRELAEYRRALETDYLAAAPTEGGPHAIH